MEQPPYSWQDADMKLYAEDSEITEWKGRFQDSKLQAWKVTEEGVVDWSLAAQGKFFSEEVYIILSCTKNTKTSPATTNYDIHCWVGKQAIEKLYKRGLYNAVALDEAMEGKALVHREVQDFESRRFTNYFEDFTVLKGGSEDSVNCNLHSAYKKRLLRITGPTGRNICVRETALKRGTLDSNDVFIVDTGTKIYQWIGKGVNRNDKKIRRVKEYADKLLSERGGAGITVVVVDEKPETKNHAMYDVFPNQAKKRKPSVQECASVFRGTKKKTMFTAFLRPNPQGDGNSYPPKKFEEMFRKEAEGPDVCIRRMNSEEASVVDIRFGKKDCDDHLFIRIGDEWKGDQKIGLIVGHYYLRLCPEEEKHPCIPITVVKEGQLSTQLNAAIGS